jgi:hypothetical protein
LLCLLETLTLSEALSEQDSAPRVATTRRGYRRGDSRLRAIIYTRMADSLKLTCLTPGIREIGRLARAGPQSRGHDEPD